MTAVWSFSGPGPVFFRSLTGLVTGLLHSLRSYILEAGPLTPLSRYVSHRS